jgi:two-component system NtrC family sensor kinase
MDIISAEQAKIDALNRKAWEIRVSDSRRCSFLSEEAIELSKPINYRKGLAEGLRTYGFALLRHSQYEQAIELLNQAMNIFVDLGDEFGQSDIQEFYGIIARSRGDYKSSLEQLYSAYQLRKDNHYTEGEILALYQLGVTYWYLGIPEKAIEFYLQCQDLSQQYTSRVVEFYSINDIGSVYLELQKPEEALKYLHLNLQVKKSQGNKLDLAGCLDKIGQSYFLLKDHYKANSFYLTANETFVEAGDKKGQASTLLHLAQLELALGNADLAYDYASRCHFLRTAIGDKKGQAEVLLLLISLGNDRDVLPLMKKALELAEESGSAEILNRVHFRYYEYYKNNRIYDKALEQLEQYEKTGREFYVQSLSQKMALLKMAHKLEHDQLKREIYRLRTNEIGGLKKENEKKEKELAQAREELDTASQQLILREKTSLSDELISVVATEIQHPLNFLNNFSESGLEMTESLISEMRKGNTKEVIKIAGELKNELKKNAVQGQYAEALLKLMLRHSQPTTGEKQLADINNLVDEYLRLAYYGMRSKDKSFNADLDLHYEKTGVKINIVPDQFGRAMYNFLNYAFNDINEKRKRLGETFEPRIQITTKKESANDADTTQFILISITINGNGIPDSGRNNLFKPFSSIKTSDRENWPGLSLCYDIIKAHQGEIKVDSMEGEYTRFTIELPAEPGNL